METKEKRKKVVAGVLALAGLLALCPLAMTGDLEPSAPPGPTMKTLDEVEPRIPIRASDLPLTITTPGSYYLVEDVSFTSTTSHAITIGCDDVMIDLMGYTLKGPDSGSTSGVYMDGRKNVEIRNGTIRDFVWPAIYEQNAIGSGHRVINIRALSSGYGIYLGGYGHLVKDCTFAANSEVGINTGTGCTITGNICYNNGDEGINTRYGSTVAGNTCYDNGSHGIYANSGCTVTDNTCYNNGDNGIYAVGGSTVTGNTVRSNTDYGIYAGNYCLIDQNTAYLNGTNMATGTGCVLGTNCAP